MNDLVVLGIDPGLDLAWSLLRVARTGRATWIAGASERADEASHLLGAGPDIVRSAVELSGPEIVVAVESVTGKPHGDDPAQVAAKAKNLVVAARIGSSTIGYALGRGLRVFEVPSTVWRRHMIGSPTPSDAQIKALVLPVVSGAPRSNEHVRDSMGVGLFVGITILRKLPALQYAVTIAPALS